MADRNTSIRRSQLKPIIWDDLDATNSPSDNYVPSYDDATKKFTWIAVVGSHDRQHSIVASADHSDKADYIDIPYSPTILTGGVLSEGTNPGTLKISALTALLRTTDSTTGALAKITLTEQDNQSIGSANTIYKVVLDYNDGSPQILIQIAGADHKRQINIGTCMKELDNTIHITNAGFRLAESAKKSHRRAGKLRKWELSNEITITDEGSKQFSISSGELFKGINNFIWAGFDSSATGETFTYVYFDGDVTAGGAWVYVPDQTDIDVDNYNDIAIGLDSFTKYKCDWVFIHPDDGHVYVVYGQQDGTIGQISDSSVPTLPDLIDTFGALVGRIIVDAGVATFHRIEVVQNVTFSPQVVIDHNDNSNIQGGTTDQYYHLTSADYTELTQWLDNVTLGSDGKLTLVSGTAINEFSTDGTLSDNSDDAVPTEKAVKTYVDNAVPNLSTSVDDFTIKYENDKLKIADRIEQNIALLAFYRAIDQSESIYNLVDGFIDEFEDETGVDTGNSTNEDYDSDNDLYSPLTLANLELDYMEYSSDELVRADWVSSDPTSGSGGIDANTKLLIHGNDGDASGQNHIPTYVGTAKIDATTYKWEKGSLSVDGDSDCLTFSDSGDWDVIGSNSDNWTIDFWVKHTDHAGSEYYMAHHEDGSNRWFFKHGDGTGLLFYVQGVANFNTGSGGEITDTDWHHVAVCKIADKYACYLDGTQVNYVQNSDVDTFAGSLYIAQSGSGDSWFAGNMDSIRINHSNVLNAVIDADGSSGTCDLPTSASTADANTKLLLNFEDGDQYGGHNVEPQGTAQIDRTTKKWGNGSWKFDGNSDYLELPDSADWDIGASNSDDWTIDLWVKCRVADISDEAQVIMSQRNGADYWLFYRHPAESLYFSTSWGVSSISATGLLADTDWHHIALIKVADKYAIYLDGTQISYTQNASVGNITASLLIGKQTAGQWWDGHMDEVRIQHSNIFNASPNDTPNDTITIPTGEYDVLVEGSLNVYSEGGTGAIVNQGTYSLKGIAEAVNSLNETITKTLGTGEHLDLTNYDTIKFDVYASEVGTNLQLQIHDSGGTTSTKDIVIGTGDEDSWVTVTWDISGISTANKDDIDSIIIKVIASDTGTSDNTFYIDNMYAEGLTQNMTLISNSQTAEAVPSDGRVIIFQEDVDAVTLNVDIKAYLSRDSGSTWAEITLADEGNYSGAKRILSGLADFTATGIGSGTNMEYRVTTHNNKDMKIHGISASWD